MSENECDPCCSQLEAEALTSNEQLVAFDVRSRDIKWPLQMRGPAAYLQHQFNLISNYREPIGAHNRREMFLCHDMMGVCMEDRHYHSSKKYVDYRFYHWSGIDYFCYCSHKYITIPPCGWINVAHEYGVRVLGTLITEGSSGSTLLHEVLHTSKMEENVVNALVKLCKHYGFEDWLVNVECRVKPYAVQSLQKFLERLRNVLEQQVESGVVFWWYDSIVENGELTWENELSAQNVRFFREADKMLINYAWTDRSLEMTRGVCEHEKSHWRRVLFGIDVCGCGQVAMFQSRQTLARMVSQRFSTGIFAPAWTFETLFATDFLFQAADLVCSYAYRLQPRDGEFDYILHCYTNNNARDCYLFLGDYFDTVSLQYGHCYMSPFKPKYNQLLSGELESLHIPKDMAFVCDLAANGWRVRYYVVAFDGPVQVKDVGVLYRKSAEAQHTAYLGAAYVNQFNANWMDFPLDSNKALIQAYGGDLLN